MKKKIIAIGGQSTYHYQKGKIQREILRLSEKENPNLLFIGYANKEHEINNYYCNSAVFDSLECNMDCLLYSQKDKSLLVEKKIKNADIIYIGGGNTLFLMNTLRKYGIDKLLIEAYNDGKVMCGSSAGAICWCKYGNSDSRRFTNNSDTLIKVAGLGLLPILLCPHYSNEPLRIDSVKEMMKTTYRIPAIGLDAEVALEVVDDKFRIIKNNKFGVAKKCFWKENQYVVEELDSIDEYRDINIIFNK